MNHAHQQRDDRRARRKSVDSTETVTNVITGEFMGQIGNVSSTGMLLICPTAPCSDAVYQLLLPLPGDDDTSGRIEVGVQEQWHQQAASTEQFWVGYRIIAISDQDSARLDTWMSLPE